MAYGGLVADCGQSAVLPPGGRYAQTAWIFGALRLIGAWTVLSSVHVPVPGGAGSVRSAQVAISVRVLKLSLARMLRT